MLRTGVDEHKQDCIHKPTYGLCAGRGRVLGSLFGKPKNYEYLLVDYAVVSEMYLTHRSDDGAWGVSVDRDTVASELGSCGKSGMSRH